MRTVWRYPELGFDPGNKSPKIGPEAVGNEIRVVRTIHLLCENVRGSCEED